MTRDPARAACHATLAAGSRSFALASALLAPESRDAVAALYAYCRHVDDAIDRSPPPLRPAALARECSGLAAVYGGSRPGAPHLAAFAAVARDRRIPREYPEELLAAMAMDVAGTRYDTLDELRLYCFRAAGSVGLMLCHVLGVSDPEAPRRAAHLGIAMQLTNICRDVAEDLADGRVYLPRAMLEHPLRGVPAEGTAARAAVCRAVGALLHEADRYYRSADAGIAALPLRSALAVHVARLVYAAIGTRLRTRRCDPFLGRAVVPPLARVACVPWGLGRALLELPARSREARPAAPPSRVFAFPRDIGVP